MNYVLLFKTMELTKGYRLVLQITTKSYNLQNFSPGIKILTSLYYFVIMKSNVFYLLSSFTSTI